MNKTSPILVTGATGYVGGRLIPELLARGYRVRAMARSLSKMGCRPWAADPGVELAAGDVLDARSLLAATEGCRAAYYLVHSMIAQKGQFAEADRKGAVNMAAVAATTGLQQIIYLGGLATPGDQKLSKHLHSRLEVARILKAGPVPVTELRAPMILGSGSASFEILRYLVDRLPVMITPRWLRSLNQPIAIRNVLHYLVGCLEAPETLGQSFDIGGPDILTYRQLLDIYAEEAGLPRRLVIPVPVLTPTLSAYWIHLISPVPTAIALPLTEGLTSAAVCTENRIQELIPQPLLSCRMAIRLALERVQQARVDTCWMDAGRLSVPEWAACGDADWAGGTILNCGYEVHLQAPIAGIWSLISRIGGRTGWYYANTLWRLRGKLDRLVGGVGLRRGRRHPEEIRVGDALDFWRVVEVSPPERLVLLAEMKVPGDALLEFRLEVLSDQRVALKMLSRFLPRGLGGLLYWYALYPFHHIIFAGMLSAIAAASGHPVLEGPRRFTPSQHISCQIQN